VLRLLVAMLAGRAAGRISRLLGRGGTAIPGLIAERIDPRTIEKLAARLPEGVVVVTGTNGKTTTTKMLAAMLERAGRRVVTNPTGSNLARGVATALIGASSWRGAVRGELAVLEIDEAAIRTLGPRLRPRVLVVTNLARDQLDRFGELQTTAGHVGEALRHAGAAVCNADDPLVAGLLADDVSFFGASEEIRSAMPADANLYGPQGDPGPHPDPSVRLERAVPEGDGQRIALRLGAGEVIEAVLRVPGPYNGYNAAAAAATAALLGVDGETMRRALESMPPAFGRGQVIEHRGRRVRLVLVKNPAGFNQAIRLLAAEPVGTPVLVAINDLDADGRDVSWLWDVALEDLAAAGHRFGTTGIRAFDMALRCKYAGIEAWAEPDLATALQRFVDAVPEGATAYVVPTYTAMLDLLALLRPGTHPAEAWR
jgi:UDP-N-acetylmuramyl tripeptide synthase